MPQLPDSLRVYAIGDIHGRYDLLIRLLDLISSDLNSAPAAAVRLVFLGDYIDRGPDSCSVLQHLMHLLPRKFNTDFLMGNHERMLLDALDDGAKVAIWLANGGAATYNSYRSFIHASGSIVATRPERTLELPENHHRFLRELRLLVQYGDYLFVHAGIRPGIALQNQAPDDLLWIREPFLSHRGSHGVVVVHGHTPADAPEFRGNRIGIDTGAVFTGRLTALVLEADTQRLLST